jgi:tetratricopeptide (TPR) repeat protein
MEPRVVEAIRISREAVLGNPRSAAAWGRLGIVLDAHELYAPAVVSYREARRLDPRDFRWAYFLARLLEISGAQPAEMAAAFEAARELNPGYVPLLVREGDAFQRMARHEDAREAYEQALARDPRFARAHRGLGQLLTALGEDSLAVRHLETAVELNPKDGASYASLAAARARAGDRAGARAAQARARELDEDHGMPDPVLAEISGAAVSADACVRRARSRIEQGDPHRALLDLGIAAEVRSEDAVVEALFGAAHAQLRQDEEALRRYAQALAIREAYPEVHVERADVLVRNGRFDEAISHYERAIELRPDEASFLAKLASARAQGGDLPGALEDFARAARGGGLGAPGQNNWGTALAQAGRPAEAVPHFEEAIRLDPRFANAHFNLGVALESLKQADRAAKHYRRAVEIDPNHPARDRLAALAASPH